MTTKSSKRPPQGIGELDRKEQQIGTTRSSRGIECDFEEQHINRKERGHEEHTVMNETVIALL
jgi:hypothetical protein